MIHQYHRVLFRVSQAVKTAVQQRIEVNGLDMVENLEQIAARSEYKQYPYHITHYDPAHENYIPAERDDYARRIAVDTHNNMLDKLKHDLKMQKQVDEALAKLDRPYLRGRPGVDKNVTGGLKDYFPVDVGHEQKETEDEDLQLQFHPMFRNEKRWIAQTLFPQPRAPWEKKLEALRDSRPVNPNYHPDKGSKYDVFTDYEHRYPYLADRLGHPEFLANPMQRLLRLESDMYHPVYNDQPFVQHPSAEPDPTLNFEEGEVLYENTRLQEWLKLNWWVLFAGYGWFAFLLPYNILYKSNLPTDAMLENNFYPYYLRSIHNFDYMKLHVLGLTAVTAYGFLHVFGSYQHMAGRYVTKIQYNKDKELIFVTKCNFWGTAVEEVFETHHLEVMPYYTKSGTQDMKHKNDDGFYEVTDINKMEVMWIYKDSKFWNPKLKKEFISNHSQLITKQYFGLNRTETQAYEKSIPQPELPTKDLPLA